MTKRLEDVNKWEGPVLLTYYAFLIALMALGVWKLLEIVGVL